MAERRDPRLVYQSLLDGGLKPRVGLVLAAIKSCKNAGDLQTGRKIHQDVMRIEELASHSFIGSALVDLYARCGCLEEARKLFKSLQSRDPVSWSCIIQGYVQAGDASSAMELYDQMIAEGVPPSRNTILGALKACMKLAEIGSDDESKITGLGIGRRIHSHAGELEKDPFVANSLVGMYSRCGSMDEAWEIFQQMPKHDVVLWNCIILGFAENKQEEMALKLYSQMQEEGSKPNSVTLVAALKAYSNLAEADEPEVKLRCLQGARSVHEQASGMKSLDLFVANALIDLYSRCGSMGEAHKVFNSMERRDVVSWNSIIQGYARSGEGKLALEFFQKMKGEGSCEANRITVLAALRACTSLAEGEENKLKLEFLEKGREVHDEAVKLGLNTDVFVLSSLIDMYAKCGSVSEAREVFEKSQQPGVVLWTGIIMAYAQNGEGEQALELYNTMQQQGLAPNRVTLLAALKACAVPGEMKPEKKPEFLLRGRCVHLRALEAGFESDPFVENTLIDMYSRCGSMPDALRVFDSMKLRDVVSWNCIIQGYAQAGDAEAALKLYSIMLEEGECSPNQVTSLAVLKACGALAERKPLLKGTCLKIVQRLESSVQLEIHLVNNLIDVYSKCGSLADARRVFESMKQWSTVSWSTMIMGLAECGEGEEALKLYEKMRAQGFPVSEVTVLASLKACLSVVKSAEAQSEEDSGKTLKIVKARYLETGRALHSEALKLQDPDQPQLDLLVANTLIDMYARCGSMAEARELFETLKLDGRRSVVSWNCLIQGYVENDQEELALELFWAMENDHFHPNDVTFLAALRACSKLGEKEAQVSRKQTWLETGRAVHSKASERLLLGDEANPESGVSLENSLVDMYAKCGSLEEARVVFDAMRRRTVVSWNCMILAYAEAGEGQLGMELFSRMNPEGVLPDSVTYMAVLKACATHAALESGRRIRDEIVSRGLHLESIMVANSLVNFFAKCGAMDEAEEMFESLIGPKKSVVSWSSLIAGYSFQGKSDRVFELFERMKRERVEANDVTYLSVLNTCSHSGLVDRGRELFEEMKGKIGPGIQHYTCMVDLLGRANRFDEAMKVVDEMEVEADVVIWTSILGAARKWKNVDVGKLAFERAVEIDPENAAVYVLMANVYASVGMWEEAAGIQAMRKAEALKP